MEQANVYREPKLIKSVNYFVELNEGKAFCIPPEITDVDGPFSEVVPAAERCWDKAERGITVQKLLVSSGSFHANLTVAGVTCLTAAGLTQKKRRAEERSQVCLLSLLSPPLH